MKNKNNLFFWGFLTPFILFFSFVVIIPFIYGIGLSFTDWDGSVGITALNFIGLDNYKSIAADPQFIWSVIYSIVFSIISVITINGMALFLAYMLTRGVKFQNLFRGIFFIPNLIGGLILGYIWEFIWTGVFVQIFPHHASPLSSPATALIATIIVITWSSAGYMMMIYIAAFNNVPNEVLESAKIDGAGGWKIFRKIQVPLMMPAFTITLFLTITGGFRQFDLIFALTSGSPAMTFMGDSILSQTTLAYDVYITSSQSYALGQAEAVILFLILVVISIIQVIITKRKEVEL